MKIIVDKYDGRFWSWAGDGGLVAFRNIKGPSIAVSCMLEILFSMPVFNSLPGSYISEDIDLRIGMDEGRIKFLMKQEK